jgi:hypothetical protein
MIRRKKRFRWTKARERNHTERFFNKLKQFRRIATRDDKLGANFLAFIQLATVRISLRLIDQALALVGDVLTFVRIYSTVVSWSPRQGASRPRPAPRPASARDSPRGEGLTCRPALGMAAPRSGGYDQRRKSSRWKRPRPRRRFMASSRASS